MLHNVNTTYKHSEDVKKQILKKNGKQSISPFLSHVLIDVFPMGGLYRNEITH